MSNTQLVNWLAAAVRNIEETDLWRLRAVAHAELKRRYSHEGAVLTHPADDGGTEWQPLDRNLISPPEEDLPKWIM